VEFSRSAAKAAARYGDCITCSALLNPVSAEAYALLGDTEGARSHAAAAGRAAAMFPSSAWRAMAETSDGSAKVAEGDRAGARAAFEAAADHYEAAGQPYWAARTRDRARAFL